MALCHSPPVVMRMMMMMMMMLFDLRIMHSWWSELFWWHNQPKASELLSRRPELIQESPIPDDTWEAAWHFFPLVESLAPLKWLEIGRWKNESRQHLAKSMGPLHCPSWKFFCLDRVDPSSLLKTYVECLISKMYWINHDIIYVWIKVYSKICLFYMLMFES